MKLVLYSDAPPSGRALLVAKALSVAADLPGSKPVYLAKELFLERYTAERPAVVTLREGARAEELVAVCREQGIVARVLE